MWKGTEGREKRALKKYGPQGFDKLVQEVGVGWGRSRVIGVVRDGGEMGVHGVGEQWKE